MRQPLRRHPDSRCLAAERIEVEIARPGADILAVSYIVTGRIGDIRMPPMTTPARRDELWQHTCFEAFVRAASGAGYYEFNFAPSTQWAAYRFDAYRGGMSVADDIGTPPISVRSQPGRYTLETSLPLDRLSALPRKQPWHLGLSALIEDTDGRRSWWALAHAPGKPDFHHTDAFAYEISTAAQS
jgi:hypothetical protein